LNITTFVGIKHVTFVEDTLNSNFEVSVLHIIARPYLKLSIQNVPSQKKLGIDVWALD